MKIKFLALLFALTTVVATAQNNTAKSTITTNLQDQGLRGITDAKLIATLNVIVDWAGSPALKRLTVTQTRALATDYPNIIYITTATAGLFTLDETDNTTADDGVNTIVTTANNKRYKRVTGSVASISGLQSALDLKAPLASPTFTGTVGGISKSMVGLANVDNISDANKPVSTAQQTALDLKANLASPTFTGTVGGITKAMVGLGNVDNISDANKPVSTATQTALNLKANLASPTFSGAVSLPTTTTIGTANGYPKLTSGVLSFNTSIPTSDISGNFAANRILGTDTQIGFWSSGVLGGATSLTYDNSNNALNVNGITVSRGAGNVSTNLAIGSGALASNITASNAVAIGSNALASSRGNRNIGIGSTAGQGITTGTDNIAIGQGTMAQPLVNNYNIALGNSALAVVTGRSNTALGFNSLNQISSGQNNIAIGEDAGRLASATGNYNVFIGDNGNGITGNNNIVWGDGQNRRLIVNSSGNVGIGTSSPATNAIMELSSTSKGLLIPRLTSAQKSAITSPEEGLMIYQTDFPIGLWMYLNSTWVRAFTSTDYTIASSNITGTAGKVPFFNSGGTMATNDIYYSTATNHFGIGISNPDSKLQVYNVMGGAQLKIGINDTDQNYINGITTFRNISSVRKFEINDNASVAYTDTLRATNIFEVNGIRFWRGGGSVSTNIGIGSSSLSSNSTGAFNTAVGNNALAASTSSNNTAIGALALNQTLTGSGNIGIGYQGGRQGPTTGNNNVYIGHDGAGTTGSNNIVIGTNAQIYYSGSTLRLPAYTSDGIAMFTAGNGSIASVSTLPSSSVSITNDRIPYGASGVLATTGNFTYNASTGLYVSGVTRSDGGIGVGAIPSYPIHATASSSSAIFGLTRTSVGTFTNSISGAMTNSAADLTFDAAQASSGFVFRTRNSTNVSVNGLGIDRDGNVGIGTTAPSGHLHVSGAGIQTIRLQSTDTNPTQIVFQGSYGQMVSSGAPLFVGTTGTQPFYLQTNGLSRGYIDGTTGFMTLGATSGATHRFTVIAPDTVTYNPTSIQGDGIGLFNSNSANNANKFTSFRMQTSANGTQNAVLIHSLVQDAPASNNSIYTIKLRNTTGSQMNEVMRMVGQSNSVGINTAGSNPNYNMDVFGTVAANSANLQGGYYLKHSTNSTSSRSWRIVNDQTSFGALDIQQSTTQTGGSYATMMYINASGNVGIGSTSPTSKLQVVGLPVYADNTAATTGGLTVGAMYRTSTGQAMIVY